MKVMKSFVIIVTLLIFASVGYAQELGVTATLFGGGLYGIGIKAKTTSNFAFDGGILYSQQFIWEAATDEEDTGPSIGYFGQIDYYFTKTRVQHYALFRVGRDDIAYELLALGYGMEYMFSDKISFMGELGLGYRPVKDRVEDRIKWATGKDSDIKSMALLLKIGLCFY